MSRAQRFIVSFRFAIAVVLFAVLWKFAVGLPKATALLLLEVAVSAVLMAVVIRNHLAASHPGRMTISMLEGLNNDDAKAYLRYFGSVWYVSEDVILFIPDLFFSHLSCARSLMIDYVVMSCAILVRAFLAVRRCSLSRSRRTWMSAGQRRPWPRAHRPLSRSLQASWVRARGLTVKDSRHQRF